MCSVYLSHFISVLPSLFLLFALPKLSVSSPVHFNFLVPHWASVSSSLCFYVSLSLCFCHCLCLRVFSSVSPIVFLPISPPLITTLLFSSTSSLLVFLVFLSHFLLNLINGLFIRKYRYIFHQQAFK